MPKSIIVALIFLVSFTNIFSQKNPTKILGAVQIDNVSSMDATEVTITEYMHFIINNDFDSTLFPNAKSISPSTKVFFDDVRKQPLFEYISLINSHPVQKENYGSIGFVVTKKYKVFIATDTTNFSIWNPIVGVSFEQAQKFCKWREEIVNDRRKVKLRITLPPLELYTRINENKDSLSKASIKVESCLRYQFNYMHELCKPSKLKKLTTHGRGLVRVDAYIPSKLRLYNIQGNAAEMTSTKGVAVGGSFRHFARESLGDKTQHYIEPEDWLGFRCYITLY